jgi:DNA-binding MarR family transcriptional regulator
MSRETREQLAGQVIYEARATEAATKRFDDLANKALGLNATDAHCLGIVDNEGGSITAGRLAELSGLTTAAITAVLDRVEAKGYARRVRDESDRRRVLVELTPLMRERAEVIWGPMAGEGVRAFASFTLDDMHVMIRYFQIAREVNERHAERIRDLRFD